MSEGLSTAVIGLFTLVTTVTLLYLIGTGGRLRRRDSEDRPDRDGPG